MDFCPGKKAWAVLAMAFVALGVSAQNEGDGSTARARGRDRTAEKQSWFRSGRSPQGERAADHLRRAYRQKLAMRSRPAAGAAAARDGISLDTARFLHLTWTSLGPTPLESDPTLFQSYGLVSGRVTSMALDQKDTTGNTLYVGSANGGVWKSNNAAAADANSVSWQPLTDDQPSLAIGALAIQPGANGMVILAGTGEANNSSDSYYGLGFLRSTDEGRSWTNVFAADGGTRPLAGLSFSRIAFHTGNPELVVAGAASSNGGSIGAELQGESGRGLYFSQDAGATWSYATMLDAGAATQPASVTDVVYNAVHAKFYAVVRAHGYYESTDGQSWTRMTQQPGAGLAAVDCPAATNANSCPLVRGRLGVRPETGEVFTAWIDAADVLSLYKLASAGSAWQSMGKTGIDSCGDPGPDAGCGAQQGNFNLTLQAVPNGSSTDIYLGAVNIFKCTATVLDPLCAASAAWKNLTHAYGCSPLGAPAHVHPGQHAIEFSSTAPERIFFANDGGVYRSLDGFALNSDACTASHPFSSLNANLGSLSQFVGLAQPTGDPGMLLGGVVGNGSPMFQAANAGASGALWRAINLGDGGYSAVAPNDANILFTSFPSGPSALIQRCASGASCRQNTWNSIAEPTSFGNDASAFFMPYQLDPKNSANLLAGTCRVWRGPATGGTFTALSGIFGGGGAGPCSGGTATGETKIRSLAAGGATALSGNAKVIYAGMVGRAGGAAGRIFVTTDADAGPAAWNDRTNGINPSEYDVSDIVISPFDATGNTAYATIMGFGVGHIYKTVDAGVSWVNLSGNLPDVPVNAIAVDPGNSTLLYAGTDVGVFVSADQGVTWAELGSGLPNVPVSKLLTFVSGGTRKLRAATFGRGVWQIDLPIVSVILAPQALTLASTVVGRTGVPQAAILSNQSSAAISLTGIAVSGPFSVSHGCPTVVVVGSSCDLIVNFHPVQGGSQNGVLTVTYSTGSRSIPVVGMGIDFLLALSRPRRPARTSSSADNLVVLESNSQSTSFEVVLRGSAEADAAVSLACASSTPRVRCTVTPQEVRFAPEGVIVKVILERQGPRGRPQRLRKASGLRPVTYKLVVSALSGSVTRVVEVPFGIQ